MSVVYNELEPYCVEWLRNLVAAGELPAGRVDERSIVDLRPSDVAGTSFHTFAGIGGWPLALRMAGWPDDLPVWTGSCPCQPFSNAGRGDGFSDERHLWPEWFRLIRECRPPVVFGEQVDSPLGRAWLDAVFADLEGQDYACGAAVLPAAGVGAPHGRHRIYLVAVSDEGRRGAGRITGVGSSMGAWRSGDSATSSYAGTHDGRVVGMAHSAGGEFARVGEQLEGRPVAGGGGAVGDLADASGLRREQQQQRAGCDPEADRGWPRDGARDGSGHALFVGNADESRLEGRGLLTPRVAGEGARFEAGAWDDVEWLECADGKRRPTQSGLRPLAHGVSGRVGKLRAYGNSIVPQAAVAFIRAAAGAIGDAFGVRILADRDVVPLMR